MASLSLDEETPEQVIQRMQRELEHVSQQSVVSHRMAVYWRERYQTCEKERASLQKKLETARKQLNGQHTPSHRTVDPADALLDWRETHDTEEAVDEAVTVSTLPA